MFYLLITMKCVFLILTHFLTVGIKISKEISSVYIFYCSEKTKGCVLFLFLYQNHNLVLICSNNLRSVPAGYLVCEGFCVLRVGGGSWVVSMVMEKSAQPPVCSL